MEKQRKVFSIISIIFGTTIIIANILAIVVKQYGNQVNILTSGMFVILFGAYGYLSIQEKKKSGYIFIGFAVIKFKG